MNKKMIHPIQRKIILCIFLTFLFGLQSCKSNSETPPQKVNMLNLLISLDDLPDGWKVEFPAGYFQASFYPQEAVKIVFIPESGTRRATVQYIYRYEDAEQADFYLNTNFIPEVVNSGEFIPVDWKQPDISADQDKFSCTIATVFRDPEKFMECKWTARYNDFIVEFFSWELPDLMGLNQIRDLIITIDQKMMSRLGDK